MTRHGPNMSGPVVNAHELVEIDVVPTEAAAMVAAAALEAGGIQCVIDRRDPSGAGAMTQIFEGLRILVPASNAEDTRELLRPATDDDSGDEDARRRAVPPHQLAEGLVEIRQRRRLVWFFFFTYLPVAAVTFAIAENAVLYVVGLWALGFMVSGIRLGNARCPRCGNAFFQRRRFTGAAWTRACVHCGLPLRPAAVGAHR